MMKRKDSWSSVRDSVLREHHWPPEEGVWPGCQTGTSVWDPHFNEYSQSLEDHPPAAFDTEIVLYHAPPHQTCLPALNKFHPRTPSLPTITYPGENDSSTVASPPAASPSFTSMADRNRSIRQPTPAAAYSANADDADGSVSSLGGNGSVAMRYLQERLAGEQAESRMYKDRNALLQRKVLELERRLQPELVPRRQPTHLADITSPPPQPLAYLSSSNSSAAATPRSPPTKPPWEKVPEGGSHTDIKLSLRSLKRSLGRGWGAGGWGNTDGRSQRNAGGEGRGEEDKEEEEEEDCWVWEETARLLMEKRERRAMLERRVCHLAGLVSEEMRALTEVRGEEEHVLVDLINSTAHLVNTGKPEPQPPKPSGAGPGEGGPGEGVGSSVDRVVRDAAGGKVGEGVPTSAGNFMGGRGRGGGLRNDYNGERGDERSEGMGGGSKGGSDTRCVNGIGVGRERDGRVVDQAEVKPNDPGDEGDAVLVPGQRGVMRSAGQKWVEPSATDLVSQYKALEEDSKVGRRGDGGDGATREGDGEGEGWRGLSEEEGGKQEGKRRAVRQSGGGSGATPLTVQVTARPLGGAAAWMSAKPRIQATRAGAAGGGEAERVGGGMGDGVGASPVYDSPETRIRDPEVESKSVNEVLAAISGVKNQLRSLMGQVSTTAAAPGGTTGEGEVKMGYLVESPLPSPYSQPPPPLRNAGQSLTNEETEKWGGGGADFQSGERNFLGLPPSIFMPGPPLASFAPTPIRTTAPAAPPPPDAARTRSVFPGVHQSGDATWPEDRQAGGAYNDLLSVPEYGEYALPPHLYRRTTPVVQLPSSEKSSARGSEGASVYGERESDRGHRRYGHGGSGGGGGGGSGFGQGY